MDINSYLTGDVFDGFNYSTLSVTYADYFPFIRNVTDVHGNVSYEGVLIDMLDIMAHKLKFRYTLKYVHDNHFGSLGDDGQWNGMVGEVMRGQADIAASALTISAQREQAIDFTYPFYEEELGVAVKTVPDAGYINKILRPLNNYVWLTMVLAALVVPIFIRAIARLTVKLTGHTDFLSSSYIECVWYCSFSLLAQGQVHQPRLGPVRFIIGTWLFMSLILYVSYSANLLVFLSIYKHRLPFNTLQEMVDQSEYKYGTTRGSITYLLFQTSSFKLFQDIHKGIDSDPTNLVNNSRAVAEGKLENEKYAYIHDTSRLKVAIARSKSCQLSLIKERFYKTGFGLAVRQDWTYKKYFDRIIIGLHENGLLDHRFQHHMRKLNSPCTEDNTRTEVGAFPISLDDVIGAFYLLGIGCGAGILALGGERLSVGFSVWFSVWKKQKKCQYKTDERKRQ